MYYDSYIALWPLVKINNAFGLKVFLLYRPIGKKEANCTYNSRSAMNRYTRLLSHVIIAVILAVMLLPLGGIQVSAADDPV